MRRGRPFVGSAEIAAGQVTTGTLRGPHFRRLFQDVYVHADVDVTYLVACEAAALVVGAASDLSGEPTGCLAGWSAAEMLGAACAPDGVPAEVLVPGRTRRAQDGLVVHRGRVRPDETIAGVRIPDPARRRRFVPGRTVITTSPLRTAFDLARREDRIEAVVALDALSRVGRFEPARIHDLVARHPRARGSSRLPGIVRLSSPLAESPMETRVRLALHDGGLPPPVLQHPVGPYRIDLAYPGLLLGIEYDGAHHRTAEQARDDLVRQEFLTARGWRILRPPARAVLYRPDAVADHVRYEHHERHGRVVGAALT